MSLAILFHFLCAQHVSDINISIIRSLWLCCWITTSVVLFCKDGWFSVSVNLRCIVACVWCDVFCRFVHEYKNIKRWLHKTTAAIWYNKTCKEKRLTPKYFKIKISDNSKQSINTQKAAIHYRINQEIKFFYLKKAKINERTINTWIVQPHGRDSGHPSDKS